MSQASNEFGKLLKQHREALGLSYRALEKLVPFSFSHLHRMEQGERSAPERDGVIAIATALRADVDEFLSAAGYKGLHEVVQRPVLQVLTGMKVDIPPTEQELAILAEVEKIPGLAFPQLTEPGFWEETPEERRETFLLIEQAVERAKRFYKLHGKKPGGGKGAPA